MKMIADNYEEDHIHPQHHPHHSHHLHSANVHHRSLPRGPPHPNHRPPMDQVIMNVHTQTQAGTDRHTHTHQHQKLQCLGLFTQVDMLWALFFMLLKLIQFHICHLHQSVVVGHGSMKFPLSLLLCLFSLNPITSCQVRLIHIREIRSLKGKAAKWVFLIDGICVWD